MSIPTIKWAWDSGKMLPSTKLVLLCLAEHSRACGCSFPSTRRISSLTKLSQRTVQHHIKLLCDNLSLVKRVKRGFKLQLPSEMQVPCSATGCTLGTKRVASAVSTKVDTNNRNIEPNKTHIDIPEWLKVVDLTTDIGLIDNIQNPTVREWIEDIEKDFSEIDILSEAKKYSLWWEGKRAKKPKLALRNWLEKARNNNGKFIGSTRKGRSTPVNNEIDAETRAIAERQKQFRDKNSE